ncbi:sugar ABC transporter substrate-binding protein [Agrococcus jejuensis]|uniref:sugar ABC transporter substrate-binding protein n=1 Tax=Agrococcus jejuensis TaxID=399736 RepID=UPI0011A65981|nr:maltose ABC transporter substrate-binding protein [Agrococcus jejuensis]
MRTGTTGSRRLLQLAAIAATGMTLVACSGGGGDADAGGGEDGGTITVWMDQNRADALGDVIASFEEESGTTVEVVIKEFGDIAGDFVTQAPGGEGPDVVIAPHDALGNLVSNGVVAPIELGDASGDFQDVAIEAMSYDGSVYGVPVSIENLALVRNTALAPEAPATWDDLVATGQAAVASGSAQYPLLVGLDPNTADPYHLYPLQASYGGPLFALNDDGTYDGSDLQIGNEGNLQFAAQLQQWGADGILNLSISQDIAKEQFAAGASPYTITGPWSLAQFDEAGIEYAIDPIPSAGGQSATPLVGVQGFMLSSYSENPIVATQFITDYMASEEAQTAIYEAGDRAPALTAAFEAMPADSPTAAFGEIGADAVPMPNVPEMAAIWDQWGATEAQIIGGQGDPTQLWTSMAEAIQSTIDAG